MEMTQIKQNKLKMIFQFSIPSIIAMFLQTVITITDGFYTGNYVGEQALGSNQSWTSGFVFLSGRRTLCRSWRFRHLWQVAWGKEEEKSA